MTVFISGGAKCSKSSIAQDLTVALAMGGKHYYIATMIPSGEEDQVKFLFKKCGVLGTTARYKRHVFGGEALAKQLLQKRARRGGVSAWLHDRGVARGDGIHQRIQRQKEGIVPRAHDQHVSVRGGLLIAFGGELRQRRACALALGKFFDVPYHIRDLGKHHPDLAHKAFKGAFAKVAFQCLADLVLMRFDGYVQLF